MTNAFDRWPIAGLSLAAMYTEEPFAGLGVVLAGVAFLVTVILTLVLARNAWLAKKKKEEEQGSLTADAAAESAQSTDSVSVQSAVDRSKTDNRTETQTPADAAASAANRLPNALVKTRASLFGRLQSLFGGKTTLGDSEREELEEILYTADLGPKTVDDLLTAVFSRLRDSGETGFEAVRRELKSEMNDILAKTSRKQSANEIERLNVWNAKPAVLMIVGVNGAGKTTTIGKLSAKFAGKGKRVLVAAGDTFRAAAGEQLKVWTERAGSGGEGGSDALVEIFDPENVTEPSAVAYQALEKAKAGGFDLVVIDTAGRLHTQKNLMEELKKMKRVLAKLDATAPHETLLVLDANSGQNALIQAKEFHSALTVDGVVLTKLDGSAKGGVAVGLANEVGLPIKMIGIGEKIGDLRPFEPTSFVDSIL